ncbi:hypothetical protein HAX54_016576 [Datura stramonium]|uniref:Uncharacterized protein n=1 Tax=Datura stramonium TaxID=4076 RepID=A0ABS8UKR3_DATST|nr:hypothetical protein [Datura stramonium]
MSKYGGKGPGSAEEGERLEAAVGSTSMGESLTEQCRLEVEGLWVVNFFSRRRRMTVPRNKHRIITCRKRGAPILDRRWKLPRLGHDRGMGNFGGEVKCVEIGKNTNDPLALAE